MVLPVIDNIHDDWKFNCWWDPVVATWENTTACLVVINLSYKVWDSLFCFTSGGIHSQVAMLNVDSTLNLKLLP